MKLSFGNMTLEMNIFNICKQPRDDNDLQEVNYIEKLVYDQFQTTSSEIKIDESEFLHLIKKKKKKKIDESDPCARCGLFWDVRLVCWIGSFCLLSCLSVGLLLEIFLFGLMRGCSPKLLNSILLCMRVVHAFLFVAVGAWFPSFLDGRLIFWISV